MGLSATRPGLADITDSLNSFVDLLHLYGITVVRSGHLFEESGKQLFPCFRISNSVIPHVHKIDSVCFYIIFATKLLLIFVINVIRYVVLFKCHFSDHID